VGGWDKDRVHRHAGGRTGPAPVWEHGHQVFWPGMVEVAPGVGQLVSLPGGEWNGTTGASFGPHDHPMPNSSDAAHCPDWLGAGVYILGKR
jgi:hypothetical protein